MIGFGAEIDGPMVVTRTIHFAATAMTAGTLIFRDCVAAPALRSSPKAGAIVDTRTTGLAWVSLSVAAVSGLIWLLLQTASMSGLGFGEAMTSGTVWTVINETQFGLVSEIRLVLAVLLAVCLALGRSVPARWLALGAALGLVSAIAWTGHAGSTPGQLGSLHLAADSLHLIAASAWLGGLACLLHLFGAGRRHPSIGWGSLQLDAVRRFSILGIISVATLIVSGAVNAWILVGSFHALLVTEYGRLLMLKLALFVVMVGFASVNRRWLTPRLAPAGGDKADPDAIGKLARNTKIEITLGLAIFAIVGVLGTLHPAIHLMN